MNTEDNAVKEVETTVTAASQSDTSDASEVSMEDYLSVIEAKDAELAKLRSEKDNYKRGLLKAKGKLDEDDESEPADLDTMIERKINEKLLSSKEDQVQREKDEAMKALAKQNRELLTALRNRSQISTGTGTGSNNDNQVKVSDHILSPDQEKNLRAKGWDDKKIELFKKKGFSRLPDGRKIEEVVL